MVGFTVEGEGEGESLQETMLVDAVFHRSLCRHWVDQSLQRRLRTQALTYGSVMTMFWCFEHFWSEVTFFGCTPFSWFMILAWGSSLLGIVVSYGMDEDLELRYLMKHFGEGDHG